MPSLFLILCTLSLSISNTIKAQPPTESCFQVIDAYSNTSQLATLCVDTSKFEVEEVPQTCDSCDNPFYGSIANALDLDYLWVLITGAMVFFMQTGFTMLEAGSVKIGNVQNILFKNMMDACVGAIGFYLFGYAVAYGDGDCSINGFIGCHNVALSATPIQWNSFFFQWAFAATAATIVSGSVAERCSLSGYFTYTIVLTVWVYPVVVHWFWSSHGWLSPFNPDAHFAGGVIDFAGSGVVHMVGGWSGLLGAVMLGPRINRFKYEQVTAAQTATGPQADAATATAGAAAETAKNSLSRQELKHWEALKSQHTLGNNVPFQVLGTFILWFGWYGFNAGSTLAANGVMTVASKVAVTSTLAAAGGGITAATTGRVLEGYFSLPRVCNGILAGLVSITAPCAVVDTGDALAIGVLGAIVYYTASRFLERVQVDDPLDAWAVHGCGGMWGIVAVGLFASSENIAVTYPDNAVLINATKGYRLSLQIFAVFIIILWVVLWIGALFLWLKFCGILRVSADIERSGLDEHDHGGVAIDYKQGYAIKDKKTRHAMTVFGRGGSGLSSSTVDQSDDDGMDGEEAALKPMKNRKAATGVVHLASGKSRHAKLRPQATPHIKQFNPIPKDAPHAKTTELVPVTVTDDVDD